MSEDYDGAALKKIAAETVREDVAHLREAAEMFHTRACVDSDEKQAYLVELNRRMKLSLNDDTLIVGQTPNKVHMVDGTPIAEGFIREGLERMAREDADAELIFAVERETAGRRGR